MIFNNTLYTYVYLLYLLLELNAYPLIAMSPLKLAASATPLSAF